MSREDGGPAFPFAGPEGHCYNNQGMTLRDYFAAKASDKEVSLIMRVCFVDETPKTRAIARYIYADAMLAARKENTR